MVDRASFVPQHGELSDNVFPNDPLFLRLLTIAHGKTAARPLVRDLNTGIDATFHSLISDVLDLRRVIVESLPAKTIHDLRWGELVFISLSAGGGYEFAVGILAILALGACACLLSPMMPARELAYYVTKTKSVMILASAQGQATAKNLQSHQIKDRDNHLVTILIRPVNARDYATEVPVPLSQIRISSDRQLNPNRPGIIIFTSGTTGPPKAVALRRSTITTGAQTLAFQLNIQSTDTLLHLLPVHHATGVSLSSSWSQHW